VKRRAAGLCGSLTLAALTACGGAAPPPPAPARSFDDPGFVASADHELRYGTVLAADLEAGVAAAYGIDRRRDEVVVNLSVLRRRSGQLPQSVAAAVSGAWHAPAGEPAELRFRAVTAGGAVSYVATAPVRDREPIVLELQALPAAGGAPLRARITRQFELR
jgi:hypothetical protein